jgi:hypothetical protein
VIADQLEILNTPKSGSIANSDQHDFALNSFGKLNQLKSESRKASRYQLQKDGLIANLNSDAMIRVEEHQSSTHLNYI